MFDSGAIASSKSGAASTRRASSQASACWRSTIAPNSSSPYARRQAHTSSAIMRFVHSSVRWPRSHHVSSGRVPANRYDASCANAA